MIIKIQIKNEQDHILYGRIFNCEDVRGLVKAFLGFMEMEEDKMAKVCKICNKFVSNKYGYCPDCWLKMSDTRRSDLVQKFDNAKGIYKENLNKFI